MRAKQNSFPSFTTSFCDSEREFAQVCEDFASVSFPQHSELTEKSWSERCRHKDRKKHISKVSWSLTYLIQRFLFGKGDISSL
jgi:phosphoribosylformylglycinamidine (FGAM) synthase-like enzyme